MIMIKNKRAIAKMEEAGKRLAHIFQHMGDHVVAGMSTLAVDTWIEDQLKKAQLLSETKGYHGYRHASCISINDELVHGVPSEKKMIKIGDTVKIDVCASWQGYCADMARQFFIGTVSVQQKNIASVTEKALEVGIKKACSGSHLSDISAVIQCEIESGGFAVVRDFAGHGIGKNMHEDPEILNYGSPGKGPILRPGMTFAIEPMVAIDSYKVYVADDGWTVRTVNGSYTGHVEDTILITDNGPKVLTRLS